MIKMFRLRKPCANCPFRKGMGKRFRLMPGRIEEIADAYAFQCHKTIDKEPAQCAGLMAILHRENRHNQIMRVADRLRVFRPEELDPDNEAYDTLSQAIVAHTGAPE